MLTRPECLIVTSWARALVLAFAGAAGALASPAAELGFNRDVRPILADHCYQCHGPDKNRRKAKLRLDVRGVAIEKRAVVPGKPEASELVRRIYSGKADEQMPPPEVKKPLTDREKDLLKRWVAAGAVYEPHWAYINPQRPAVPEVKARSWPRDPIDQFILHTLEAKGISPSPEAGKARLLRRLSLDLIGLPPTPAEVSAFLRDRSPHAYERAVERLLASPHFGERMAVPWLDVVRFADTVGYHGDQNVNVFPYRDYVIQAFNQNKPFDQFTIEQLAGDLLPHPTTEQLIATGFNRLNMVTREGGAQPKEYLAKYAADRVRTVAMAWLGSTMGCCECHDHKFDPFTTRDFYSMEAFFADLKQWGVYQDYEYTPNADLKGWSNDHPFPPELEVDSPYLQRRLATLEQDHLRLRQEWVAKLKQEPSAGKAFQDWRRSSLTWLARQPSGWAVPVPAVLISAKDTNTPTQTQFAVLADGSILFTGKPGDDTVQVSFPLPTGRLTAIRMELLPRPEHSGQIIRGEGTNTTLTLSARLIKAGSNDEVRLRFYYAAANHHEDHYANGYPILGVQDRWTTAGAERHSPQTAVWFLDEPIIAQPGDVLRLSLGKSAVGCVRIAMSPLATADALDPHFGSSVRRALSDSGALGSRAEKGLAAECYLLSTHWDAAGFTAYRKLEREILECHRGRSPTVVAVAWQPAVTRVLPRGNWQDEGGPVVEPAVPQFLPPIANPDHRRLTRLDLARWLVSRDNPLTARAIVNRLWKEFFGTGLSAVVDDLGTQGDWPSYPELLDWLAVEFRDSGWDFKHLVRLMVLSSAYRQDSNERPELKEIDPANRLVAYQSPRRLEAEFVRDNALTIAGLLNLDLGGPSVHPYQPGGYYANLQFPDRDYVTETDSRQYRRGVYAHWQRTFLQPMLANFDAPAREECIANRTVSNTPQQALTLLNDPTFVEAARVFAAHLIGTKRKSDDARLDLAFETALARPIQPKEEDSLRSFLALQRDHYRQHPEEAQQVPRVGASPAPRGEDPIELAAWTSVARVILNLHETITRY